MREVAREELKFQGSDNERLSSLCWKFELILKLTDHLYVESNFKERRGTNELIYKTEVESQM